MEVKIRRILWDNLRDMSEQYNEVPYEDLDRPRNSHLKWRLDKLYDAIWEYLKEYN